MALCEPEDFQGTFYSDKVLLSILSTRVHTFFHLQSDLLIELGQEYSPKW